MKRIRMLEQYSGPRYDGRMWPPAGTEFEVDDDEAAGLVRQGVAELVKPPATAARDRVREAARDLIGEDPTAKVTITRGVTTEPQAEVPAKAPARKAAGKS